jgi:putative tryptophan/tyrosine transport system substrate-binding protein
MSGMGRREFVALLGGAAAWPQAVRAQQAAVPVVGFLSGLSPDIMSKFVDAFRQGLSEAGYVEGRNAAIEYRWAEGEYDRLPALAEDLVRHRVGAIVAVAVNATHAAKAATGTIPIVFFISGDPVAENLVTSLNRPSGNLTGVTTISGVLSSKRLELLRELVPSASVIAVLINPNNSNAQFRLKEVQEATRALGQQIIHVVNAGSEGDIEAAFAALVQRGAGALLVIDDPLFNRQRLQLVALAARYRVATIYFQSEFVSAGGLISYATNYSVSYRQAGIYTGRILKGEKPADLPVMQPTKFELVINLKTAKALGLTIPPTLLARADEVIE